MNGDGFTDLFLASQNRYHTRLNTGGGTFGPPITLPSVSNQFYEHSFPIDINGDGSTEVVIASSTTEWGIVEFINGGLSYRSLDSTNYNQIGNSSWGDETRRLGAFVNLRKERDPKVIDMDGNGLPDLLVKSYFYPIGGEIGADHWQIFMNYDGVDFTNLDYGINVSMQELGPLPHIATSLTMLKAEGSQYAQPIDIDGDGKQELLFSKDNQWSYMESYIEPESGLLKFRYIDLDLPSYSVSTLKIVDLNADGLSDLLYKRGDNWAFNINQGGHFLESVRTTSPHNSNSQAIDYNDDGSTDILYESSEPWSGIASHRVTWKVKVFKASEECYSDGINCFENVSTGVDSLAYKDVYRISDFDGDGLVDIITQSDRKWRVFTRSTEGLPNYLESVTNGYGLKTSFEYGQLFDHPDNAEFYEKGDQSQLPVINISGPMRVVKSTNVKKTNGFQDTVSYKYKQLATHTQGLGSLGFKEITSITPFTKTRTIYDHNWQARTHGMIDEQMISKREDSSSDVWTEVSNTIYSNDSIIASDNTDIRHIYTKSVVESTRKLNGALFKKTTTTYTPDTEEGGFNTGQDYGNNLSVIVRTTEANSENPAFHQVETTNYYDQENSDSWIIGRLNRSEVTHTASNRARVERASTWTYDFNGYLTSETIESGELNGSDSNLAKTTSYTYNSLGLKETTTTTIDSSSYSARSTTTYYDAFGRFPIRVVNDLGETSTAYDPVLGLATRVTGLNNLSATVSYDGFGRQRLSTSPDGTYTETTFHDLDHLTDVASYYWDESGSGVVASISAEYYVQKVDQNGVWTRTYFDRLGNTPEVRTLNGLGEEVRVRTEFDLYGNQYRQSEPYKAVRHPSIHWSSVSERDALHRATKQINQRGDESRVVYDGLLTKVINEKGQTKTELKTVDGKLYQVRDNDGYVVQYEYDAAGNMTKMIDLGDVFPDLPAEDQNLSNNVTTNINYDALGRKISMQDPNKGTWFYTHNAFGELVMQQDANEKKTCQAYDSMGRMILRIDDYKGSPEQAINHCEGTTQSDLKTQWFYDTASNGIGKLARVTGPDGYEEAYKYDYLGRVISVTKTIASETFETKTTYNDESRPLRLTYPSGLSITNRYNSYGLLDRILKGDGSDVNQYYWALEDVDARGQATSVLLGNGAIATDKTYEPERGLVSGIVSTNMTGLVSQGTGNLQQSVYDYDQLGNIQTRHTATLGQPSRTEHAYYDSMNRLTRVERFTGDGQTLLGTEHTNYHYNGNVKNKWNVSGGVDYQYGNTCNGVTPGPHAVSNIGSTQYCYDNNGSLIRSGDRLIEWASFGKPTKITKGLAPNNVVVDFVYGPDRSRILRTDNNVNGQTTTTYVGSYERVKKPGDVIDERHYIGGVVIVNRETNGDSLSEQENYLLKDNLGSVVATINLQDLISSGNASAERTSFDPWGLRRNADWTDLSLSALYTYKSSVTDRGFTGHEQIDEVGLIHMNGRVYDPLIGRFISADPIIQSPTDLQSLNRYTYVRNNPLTLIDPSGFSWLSKQWKKWGKDFVANVVTMGAYSTYKTGSREFRRFARKNKYIAELTTIAGCAAVTAGTAGAGAGFCAAISTAVTYSVTDGDFEAAVRAGATAFVTAQLSAQIGGAYEAGALGGTGALGKFNAVALHGMLGGTMSVANGGKFGHGFASGAAGKAFSFGLQSAGLSLYNQGATPGSFANVDFHHITARTAIAAAIGGTVSEFGGGTFANGAVTAAMQHLFNGEDLFKMVDNGGHSQTMGGAIKEKIWGAHHNTEPTTCGMAEMAACVGLGVVYGDQESAEYMAELSDVGESMNKVDEIATKTGIDPDRHVLKPLKASSDSIQILDNITKIPQIYKTCISQCLERAQNSHTQF